MNIKEEIEKELAGRSEQRGDYWKEVRIGKFTGSEMVRLLADVKREMTEEELKEYRTKNPKSKAKTIVDPNLLSDGAMTYVWECVAETLTGQAMSSPSTWETRWGEEHEGYAREAFEKKYDVRVMHIGSYIHNEHAASSPDGEIEFTDEIIEIKCPANSAIHAQRLLWNDPLDIDEQIYCQMQTSMAFGKKSKCYFISYDPRMKKPEHQLKVIEVPAVKRYQDMILHKLKLAIEKKIEILKTLDNK